MRTKKANSTMALPFGIIFSIFLIIIFVVFAFKSAGGFLDVGKSTNIGLFYDELQEAINDAMRSQSSSYEFEPNLPSGIDTICFANFSNKITNPGEDYETIKDFKYYGGNIFLLPPEKAADLKYSTLDYLDVDATTATENPFCLDVKDGLIIKKDFYDKLVTIERVE